MKIKSLPLASHLEAVGHGTMAALGAAELGQIEAWFGPIGGPLRARMLAALVNDTGDASVVEACAASIAGLEQWSELLRELLVHCELSPPVVSVAHLVLRSRLPSHPLADAFGSARTVVLVCDALCDGDRVTFRLSDAPDPSVPWLFIDPEDVTTRFAETSVRLDGASVSLSVSDLPWLDRAQVACSAFALIA